MTSSDSWRFDSRSPDGSHTLVVEEDERVAYAYLLRGPEIVGDVWLYNVAPTPEETNWKDPAQMPFLNPRAYCASEAAPNLRQGATCRWSGARAELSIAGW